MRRVYRSISAALLLLLIFQPLYGAEPGEVKRVLVLCSEDRNNPGQGEIEEGIREGFHSTKRFDVQLYTEYLDVSRFRDPSHAPLTADFLRRKYSGMEIHVIITVYPHAVDFLLANRQGLFPEVPVVAAAITGSYAGNLESSTARRFVTGTILRGNLAGLIDSALRLRPKTKHIAVISGTAPNDIFSDQQDRAVLKRYAEKIDLIDLTKLSMEDTLSRVASLSPDTIVYYSTILRDGAGKSFVSREALSPIARASKVPVFGFFESYLGFGIVGGRLMSLRGHGKEAADLSLRVMGGELPASIPFSGEQAYVTAYDWRELKRWNIPETALPAGAEIRYRMPSFWEEYRRTIIGVITLITVETCLILGLLINFRRRRKAERSLRESEERLGLAADSAGAGLWSLNLTTGSYWVTKKTRELFDFPSDEVVTFDRVLGLVHPDDRALVRQTVQENVESKNEGRIEYRIIRSDGKVRWMASQGRVHSSVSGEPDHLMGVCVDITDRKLMEEELRNRFQEIENLKQQLEKENVYLREEVNLPFAHDRIIGQSAPIQHVLAKAEQVAGTDSTVLITGETGTGKELVARTIHDLSKRRNQVMIKVDCAALPPSLIESELFGREKGAYTGAMTREIGRFEMADGSTLFLDEIGELEASLQTKLLRLLESGEFERLGSPKTIRVDVRVIAATNRNLAEEVHKGAFREDLYYRLNVFPIEVPPLRERREDIPLLVQAFVKEFNKKMSKKVQSVPKKAMDQLQRYAWPGNVRELRNIIEHAIILSKGEILNLEMPKRLIEAPAQIPTLDEAEKQLIVGVLEKTDWRIKGPNGAAEILKLKPSTLYNKMVKLGIPFRKKDRIPS